MRNAAMMAVNRMPQTLPQPWEAPVEEREIRGKVGVVGQVGFRPHRNKPL